MPGNTVQTRFVLIGTTHSGNLGAVARAMKTMGFSALTLVAPQARINQDAFARASGANHILKHARIVETLDEAVADCHEVIGTSARERTLSVPVESCRPLCRGLATRLQSNDALRVALVFGRERSGLENHEVDRCTRLLTIETAPDFASLNLGSAVQVVAWELASALRGLSVLQSEERDQPPPADSVAMQHFFNHLERSMIETDFLDPEQPKHLMRRLRVYFERNRPDAVELNILRGILAHRYREASDAGE